MRMTTQGLLLALGLTFGCSGGDAQPRDPHGDVPAEEHGADGHSHGEEGHGHDDDGHGHGDSSAADHGGEGHDAGGDHDGQAAGGADGGSSAPSANAATGEAALGALRKNVSDTAGRDEHSADAIDVTHILIAFKGASRSSATRSKEEAEQLAADILARALVGEDFESLRQEFTDDRMGGKAGDKVYSMSLKQKPRSYQRSQMVPAFGDVGWRLEVDQIGVAPHQAQKSPFGWHIIKRLK